MSEEKTADKTYLAKWAGKSLKSDLPSPQLSQIIWSFIGGFVGIAVIAYLAMESQLFPLFAPFGASAVLLYGAPAAPFSQPRNLIGGHFISALVGVLVWHLIGTHYLAVALAVSLAIVCMLVTKTVHPPAGATALLGVASSQGSFLWILAPVGIGAVILLIIALIINNLDPKRIYPLYWY